MQRKGRLGLRRYREEPGVYWRSGFEIVGVCVVDYVFVPFYEGGNEEQAKLLEFFFEDFVPPFPRFLSRVRRRIGRSIDRPKQSVRMKVDQEP
jgi:hypothetical protein